MTPDQVLQIAITAGSCISAVAVASWNTSAKMTAAWAGVKLELSEVNSQLKTITRDIEELQREINEARLARAQLWERLNGLREKSAAHSARLESIQNRKAKECP